MATSGNPPEGSSDSSTSPMDPRGSRWLDPRVLVALIGTLGALIVGYWQLPKLKESPKEKLALVGRVYARSSGGIEGATLTLDLPGEGSISRHSRDQGSFLFSELHALRGTLTVSATGYRTRTLDVIPTNAAEVLEVELAPNAEGPPGGSSGNNPPFDPPPERKVDPAIARAEANAGWSYEIGQGTPQNYAGAMKWYRKAVEDGDVIANWNIARLYEHGWGVQQDLETARSWYQKAADGGFSRAREDIKNIGHNPPY